MKKVTKTLGETGEPLDSEIPGTKEGLGENQAETSVRITLSATNQEDGE